MLDPPRDTATGQWAMEGCLSDEVQDRFFEALLTSSQDIASAAADFAQSCQADPAARYDSTVQAQAVRSALAAVADDRDVIVYAASADVHTAAALRAEGITAEAVILDSVVGSEVDGLAMVESQASGFTALTPQLVAGDPARLGKAAATPDTTAFTLSLMRMPDVMPEDRASILADASDDDIANVGDQYFRRYGEAEYSPLNAVYYSGLCRMYAWPADASDYDAAQQRAEEAAVKSRVVV